MATQAGIPTSAALFYILNRHPEYYMPLVQALKAQQEQAAPLGKFKLKLPKLPSISDIKDGLKKINSPSDLADQVKKINSPSDIVDVVKDIKSTVAHALLPESVLKDAAEFEKNHRKEIQIAALIAAVVMTGGAAANLAPNLVSSVSGAVSTTVNAVRNAFAYVMDVPGADKARQLLDLQKLASPKEVFSAQNIADQMKGYVDKIGAKKFNELVAKYQKPNPSEADVAAFSAALTEAATGVPTSTSDVAAFMDDSQKTPWTAYALPLLTVGAAVIA